MCSAERKRLYLIACEAREWAEKKVSSFDWFGSDLGGFCAIAARKLLRLLRAAGFEDARLCVAEDTNHVFVKVHGFIVDTTATQFGYCPVEVVSRPIERNIEDWWYEEVSYRSERALISYLRREGWAEHCVTLPGSWAFYREKGA